MDDLLKAVVRREIDQICVWSIDRLGQTLRDLVNVLDELRQKGCDLYVHKQAIDTNTPSGKMLFQILGVFAEFEREIIRQRIIAGTTTGSRSRQADWPEKRSSTTHFELGLYVCGRVGSLGGTLADV